MSDGPDSSVLRYFRSLSSKVNCFVDDAWEIKGHLGALEECSASVSRRLASLEIRMERAERRFDLMETLLT
jgi:hypothetical protein